MIYIILLFVGYYFFVYLGEKKRLEREKGLDNPFSMYGQLVYADGQSKKSRSFVNKRFGLCAKPDFIFRNEHGTYTLIEYKSRQGKVYQSDIQQTIASVMAARTKFNITEAYVHTDNFRMAIDAGKSNAELYSVIERNADLTRDIKSGRQVNITNGSQYKCPTCSMKHKCDKW